MTKQATIQFRADQDQKDILVAIANKQRVSPSDVYRWAIYEYIQAHAPNGVCPNCQSMEVQPISAPVYSTIHGNQGTRYGCADCGWEWEV